MTEATAGTRGVWHHHMQYRRNLQGKTASNASTLAWSKQLEVSLTAELLHSSQSITHVQAWQAYSGQSGLRNMQVNCEGHYGTVCHTTYVCTYPEALSLDRLSDGPPSHLAPPVDLHFTRPHGVSIISRRALRAVRLAIVPPGRKFSCPLTATGSSWQCKLGTAPRAAGVRMAPGVEAHQVARWRALTNQHSLK